MFKKKVFYSSAISRLDVSIRRYWMEHWVAWAKIALILGSISGAAVLGFIAGKKNPLYAIVAACLPLAVAGVEILLRTKENWPTYILLVAAYVPFSLPTGTESRLVISFLITIGMIALWVLQMVVRKHIWIYPSPINPPLLGFSLVVMISLFWSNWFRDPLVLTTRTIPIIQIPFVQVASAITMIMLPGAFFITANHIQHIKNLVIMVWVMLATGALGLLARFTGIPLPVNTEGLSAMWFIALALSLIYFDKSLNRKIKSILAIIVFGWIYWGFVLHISWLAGWLPGMVALGILTLRRSKVLTLIGGIAGLIILIVNSSYFFGTVLGNETSESGITRLAAWEINWLITGKHLLFGTGPAGYAAYYMTYFPTNAMATHNNYLDILSQTGIIGITLCLWFFGVLLWRGYKLCNRLRGRGDFAEALANAALAGAIGSAVMMGFGDWLFPFAYTQGIIGFNYAVYCWVFMGTLVALDRLIPPEKAEIAHA
jgi:O-antigen ligase